MSGVLFTKQKKGKVYFKITFFSPLGIPATAEPKVLFMAKLYSCGCAPHINGWKHIYAVTTQEDGVRVAYILWEKEAKTIELRCKTTLSPALFKQLMNFMMLPFFTDLEGLSPLCSHDLSFLH